MRAVFDTNVLVSYLLYPEDTTTIGDLMNKGLAGDFELIILKTVQEELHSAVTTKPYLRNRISIEKVDRLIAEIRAYVDLDASEIDAPAVRDPSDRFILLAAIAIDADFLVSGDSDLRVIAPTLDRPQIVTPAEFLAILDQQQGE